jgi:hypothetical protein
MPRLRTLKPAFFANEELAAIPPLGRLLFEGLWCIADRRGRLEDRPSRIKAEILPYDRVSVDSLLNKLAAHGFIERYEVTGVKYIQVVTFEKHQNPHIREAESIIPPPVSASGLAREEHGAEPGRAVPFSVFGIRTSDLGKEEKKIGAVAPQSFSVVDESFVAELVALHGARLGGVQAVRDKISLGLEHATKRGYHDQQAAIRDYLRLAKPTPETRNGTTQRRGSPRDRLPADGAVAARYERIRQRVDAAAVGGGADATPAADSGD